MHKSTAPVHRAGRGFTLIEMLLAISVAGLLSGIAYPSFQGVLHQVRRADAYVALLQAQAAQERWRANHREYGASLAEIGAPTRSPAGHYTLEVLDADADGYVVVANAAGRQARDLSCRTLKLTMNGATVSHASGSDALAANAAATNRRCWAM
jgi:type IV pilus assembly protein PilE